MEQSNINDMVGSSMVGFYELKDALEAWNQKTSKLTNDDIMDIVILITSRQFIHKIKKKGIRTMKPQRKINIGDIFFYGGKTTKLKVIADPEKSSPVCEVLAVGSNSKYKPGDKGKFSRRSLFPRQGKR